MTHEYEFELTQTQLEVLQLALQNSLFQWVDTVKNEAEDFEHHCEISEANLTANASNLVAAYQLREIFGRTQ